MRRLPMLMRPSLQEGAPVHLGGLREPEVVEDRGRDVGEAPAAAQLAPHGRAPIAMNGTGFVVCAVWGWPVCGSTMVSQLP